MKETALAQHAWAYLNDASRLDLCVRFATQHIACAAILMASRRPEVRIALPSPQWIFAIGADPAQVAAICDEVLANYDEAYSAAPVEAEAGTGVVAAAAAEVSWLEPLHSESAMCQRRQEGFDHEEISSASDEKCTNEKDAVAADVAAAPMSPPLTLAANDDKRSLDTRDVGEYCGNSGDSGSQADGGVCHRSTSATRKPPSEERRQYTSPDRQSRALRPSPSQPSRSRSPRSRSRSWSLSRDGGRHNGGGGRDWDRNRSYDDQLCSPRSHYDDSDHHSSAGSYNSGGGGGGNHRRGGYRHHSPTGRREDDSRDNRGSRRRSRPR